MLKLTALRDAADDLASLPTEALRREALRALVRAQADPPDRSARLGYHAETGDLDDCRKIYFDEPDFGGRPRWRIVVRLLPSDVAPTTLELVAIGRRDRLYVYLRAARRLRRAGGD